MFELIVGFIAGLVVGWNFLPQPEWVSEIWSKFFGKSEDE
jgi:hypothetical protein